MPQELCPLPTIAILFFFTWRHPPHSSLFHFRGFGCKISEFLCSIEYPQLVQFPSNLHKIDLIEPTILKTSHSAIAQPCAKSLFQSTNLKQPRKFLTIVWNAYKSLQMGPCILLSKQCFIPYELVQKVCYKRNSEFFGSRYSPRMWCLQWCTNGSRHHFFNCFLIRNHFFFCRISKLVISINLK